MYRFFVFIWVFCYSTHIYSDQISLKACEIGIIEANEIDKINILNASIKAMHNALDKIKINFDIILVDGPHFKTYRDFQHECMVRGDSKYLAIAAASIIAKTYRDELMFKLHEKNPEYKWCRNKGYPTYDHRNAIHKYGISNYHRKSFKLIDNQTSLNI
jgi:ribonuclease HII